MYAGNHGLEISGAGLQYLHPAAAASATEFAAIADALGAALAAIPGAQVENKTLSLTVHYRRTPVERHPQVESIVGEIARDAVAGGRARISAAKAAIELRPSVDWDKGRALELARSRLAPDAFPIYVGDDATDEDAFRAAQDAGGCGVFVGPAGSTTCATRRLDSPAAVTEFLERLASM